MNIHRLTALPAVPLAGTCIATEPVTAQGQDSTALPEFLADARRVEATLREIFGHAEK